MGENLSTSEQAPQVSKMPLSEQQRNNAVDNLKSTVNVLGVMRYAEGGMLVIELVRGLAATNLHDFLTTNTIDTPGIFALLGLGIATIMAHTHAKARFT